MTLSMIMMMTVNLEMTYKLIKEAYNIDEIGS